MHALDTHVETALDSPYSRDRADAIEQLGSLYPEAGPEDRRRIAETLREVAVESAHRDDRALARETLVSCFEAAPDPIQGVVVDTFVELARDGRDSDSRLAAIDDLRGIYPDLDEAGRDEVGRALAELAGNDTYAKVRRRARRRLSDVTRDERAEADDEEDAGDETIAYLGQSLADHLDTAARESAEDCRERAEELREFLEEHPVEDEAYEDVREETGDLLDALAVVSGDQLADDRIERVERLAARVERLYRRQG